MTSNGNGIVHTCAACGNETDKRSALWFVRILPEGTTFEQFRDWDNFPFRDEPVRRMHDTCMNDLIAGAKAAGRFVRTWKSPELRKLDADRRAKEDALKRERQKKDVAFQNDLDTLLGRAPKKVDEVVETKSPAEPPAPAKVVSDETPVAPKQPDSHSWIESLKAAKERVIG